MEESAGKKRPGATQVMSLTLIDTRLHIGSCGPVGAAALTPADNSGRPPAVPVGGASSDSLRVAVSVGDVRLQDLQSCVEHRNVLSATNWRRDDQASVTHDQAAAILARVCVGGGWGLPLLSESVLVL